MITTSGFLKSFYLKRILIHKKYYRLGKNNLLFSLKLHSTIPFVNKLNNYYLFTFLIDELFHIIHAPPRLLLSFFYIIQFFI